MGKEPMKATETKTRFEEIVGALLSVPKEEADEIMDSEKKPRSGKKRGRKPKE
jgi:hypothetical protein